ncbi:MAG: anti-sigma factor family protein [Planctomycetota bacterium]
MKPELIDFLLGELPEEQAAEVERRLAGDPELAREAETYREALGILREAASEAEWPPAKTPIFKLVVRSSLVAAALLLIALGIFWMDRNGAGPQRVFEPDGVFGALLPEELGADGSTRPEAHGDDYRLRGGSLNVSAIGARESHPLSIGDPVLEDSELTCGAESGAYLSLPNGGLLFIRPLSTVQLRQRNDGRVALRLLSGAVATVAGDEPMHLAVDGTDLLFTQYSGAALLRHQESDALCLRGRLELHVETGERWLLPVGHRLPAACARAPESEPFLAERLELDWYESLVGQSTRHKTIRLDVRGRSKPIQASDGALLYLYARCRDGHDLKLTFGEGEGRIFPMRAGTRLEIRIPLSSLGKGPILTAEPAHVVKQLRLLELE